MPNPGDRPLRDVSQFGEREPGWTYEDRPSAYAICRDDSGNLLCVRAKETLHLPGGGLLEGESAREAVRRELREETGYDGVVLGEVARANQYVVALRENIAVNKRGIYFEVRLAERHDGATDHEPVWVPLPDAAERLAHESHRWAVARRS